MVTIGTNNFGVIDYIIVGFSIVASLGIGIYPALRKCGQQTSEEMLMGGRKMTVIPIAISMLVTYLSANAVVGYPSEIYTNGIQIFWIQTLLVVVCIPASAYLFMTVFYKLKLSSVYEYFELRFESVPIRSIASFLFIVQTLMLCGVVLSVATMTLEALLGLPSWVSALGIGTTATAYTVVGGLKAVVWTDTFQFLFIMVGMISIVVKGFITAGGVGDAFAIASQNGRLNLFDWTLDPFQRYNTFNILVGHGVSLICFYGVHQSYVQRYSSLPTLRHAVKAMAWNALLKEIINVIVICTGVAVFATYAGCDPIRLGEIKKADQLLPYFFVKELSFIPGMVGIFTSCIVSAVLSTISSVLNSVSAVAWQDFLNRIPYFYQMDSTAKGRVTGVVALVCGILTILLSFIVSKLGSIFRVMITIVGAFSGTIGGVFIMGLFLPCVNKLGALVGLVSSLIFMGFLATQGFLLKVPYATLPTNIDSCPAGTILPNMTSVVLLSSAAREYDWPTKLYTVTYILYPPIGCFVTILVGVIVSLVSRFWVKKQPRRVLAYLHPVAKRIFSIETENEAQGPSRIEIRTNGAITKSQISRPLPRVDGELNGRTRNGPIESEQL